MIVIEEPLSPELVLVDPDLAARARAALPMPSPGPARRAGPAPEPAPTPHPAPPPRARSSHPYPLWARVTAAAWLVVLGILIGGAAIPHAQDTPHLITGGGPEPARCTPKTPVEPVPATGLQPGK
jgi:hypothetical protein